ncbi:MAG: hypothetical protein HY606_11515 [Planctomycetes bacterium]|nr:hypothetical protein [Planctomycetota bacterium]
MRIARFSKRMNRRFISENIPFFLLMFSLIIAFGFLNSACIKRSNDSSDSNTSSPGSGQNNPNNNSGTPQSNIPFNTIYKGDPYYNPPVFSGDEVTTYIVSNSEQLAKLKGLFVVLLPLPNIDFSIYTIIVAIRKGDCSILYDLEITGVSHSGSDVVVDVKLLSSGQNCPVAACFRPMTPSHIATIPITSKNIRFSYTSEAKNCN